MLPPSFDHADPNSSSNYPPHSTLDSLFFLPTSPMMSCETAPPPTSPTTVGGKKGNLYDALHAVHSQQQPAAPPDPLLSVFDMAASPTLSPMSFPRGSPTAGMFRRGPMDDFCLSPGLDGFLMGGLSVESPRSARSSVMSPQISNSNGSGRVTKVPMRRHRHPQQQQQHNALSPRQFSAINHQPPLPFMMLPCQIDPKTNKTSPHPGCPEVLLSPLTNNSNNNKSPAFMLSQAPMFNSHQSPFGGPPDMSFWLADFAAHRAAFLQDYHQLDFENVTVVEMKAMLRRYGIARAGKKHDLEERLKQIAIFLQTQIEKEKSMQEGGGKGDTVSTQDEQENLEQKALDDQAVREASIYINA